MLFAAICILTVVACKKEKECDKTDPNSTCYVPPVQNDPNKELIERLEKDSIPAAEKKVRGSFEGLSTLPAGYQGAFLSVFNQGVSENLLDTAQRAIISIEIMWRNYGNPLPEHNDFFLSFYNNCKEYIRLVEKLKELKGVASNENKNQKGIKNKDIIIL